jgi:hypothetical protein
MNRPDRIMLLALPLCLLLPAATRAQTPSDTLVTLVPPLGGWVSGRMPVAGIEGLTLFGSAATAGPYVVRTRFQDGAGIGPHYHDQTTTITVLAGTFHFGIGSTSDRSAARAYPPGSFIVLPARTPHFEWGEGETVIQLSGDGPLGNTPAAPGARQ